MRVMEGATVGLCGHVESSCGPLKGNGGRGVDREEWESEQYEAEQLHDCSILCDCQNEVFYPDDDYENDDPGEYQDDPDC